MQLATMLEVPTHADFCYNRPITLPIGYEVLPMLNSLGRTVDAMLPDGNCLFRSLSKALFAVPSGHLTIKLDFWFY